MPVRLSQKTQINIPHETANKRKEDNTRFNAFVKQCVKELKAKGETICFSQKQIEQIKKYIDITEICYDERNDCYYVFSKR